MKGYPFTTSWSIAVGSLFLRPALAYTYFSEEAGSCRIIGDADVYGIGIRLGFYFQYAAVMLCIFFDRTDELKSARQGFNAFSLAILINLWRNASRTLALEWYICSYLVFAIPLSAIPVSLDDLKNSYSALLTQNMLYIVLTLSNAWLAFNGMKVGLKPGCTTEFFVFVKAYNTSDPKFIAATKAGTIILIVLFVPIFLLYPITALGVPTETMFNTDNQDPNPSRANSISDSGSRGKKKNRGVIFWIRLIGFSLLGAISILSVELMLKKGNIDMSSGPITAAGQLIPLIIGVYVLFTTIMGLLKEPFSPVVKRIQEIPLVKTTTRRWVAIRALFFSSQAYLPREDYGQEMHEQQTTGEVGGLGEAHDDRMLEGEVARGSGMRDAETQVESFEMEVPSIEATGIGVWADYIT